MMQKVFAIAVLALIGAGIYALFDRATVFERASARRALETRAAELTARALVPGSSLACLDGAAGDAVESACEKILFARAETVAAAVSYTASRLDLLTDGIDFVRRSDPSFDGKITGLRRAVELDRYGIAAHVLAARDGCTADKCAALSMVNDPATLRSNMRARVFAQYVDRYSASWTEREPASPPQAQTEAPPPVAALQPPVRPVPSARFDFPSAASIPPVSIMNPEPKGPSQSSKDDAADAQGDQKTTPTPPRRPQNQAGTSGAR